jgi:hypothetical protein
MLLSFVLDPFHLRADAHSGGYGYLTIPVDLCSTPRAAAHSSGSRSCSGPGRGCHCLELIVSLQLSKNLEEGKHKLVETKYK